MRCLGWPTGRRPDRKGQGYVEYALLLGLVAVVAISALNLTGGQVGEQFDSIAEAIGDHGKHLGQNKNGNTPPGLGQ